MNCKMHFVFSSIQKLKNIEYVFKQRHLRKKPVLPELSSTVDIDMLLVILLIQ